MSDYDEAVKINNYLKTLEHNLQGQPIFRCVLADEQTEMREGTYNEFHGSLFLRTVYGVKRVPKYPHLAGLYIIEQWFDLSRVQTDTVKDHNGYECIYAFRNPRNFKSLPLQLRVVELIMKAKKLYRPSPMLSKSLLQEAIDEKERRLDQHTFDAIDPSSPIESALHFKEGVSYSGLDIPGSEKRDMPRTHKAFPVIPVDLQGDPCTLISIVPFPINEFKPGIYPGRFVMPDCKDFRQPVVISIGDSVHFVPQFNGDDELPAIVIRTSAREISKSIVNDYFRAQMDVNEECCPGLTWLPKKLTSEEFVKQHMLLHRDLQKYQLSWFGKLVQRADNDWNRFKRHTVISDNQRFACRALGMERDWLTTNSIEVPIKCPACLQRCDPSAVVCATCRHILNPEKYKGMAFAS